MALFSANENYDYYDFIHLKFRSPIVRNSAFPRLITPITETDVIIRTTVMLDGRFDDSGFPLLMSKSGGTYYWIGCCIRPSRYGGTLVLYTSSDVDDEGVSGWIQTFAQEYQFEARFSLNDEGSDNYVQVGTHQITNTITGTQTDELEEPWSLFGQTDGLIGSSSLKTGNAYIGETFFYDYTDTDLLADLVPCIQMPLKRIGMFDKVSNTFCPAEYSDGRDIGTDFELVNAE
jgi:hypothetical protein